MLKVTSCAYRKTHFLLLKSAFWLLITLINSRFLPKKNTKNPSILRCFHPQFPLKSTQQVPQNGRHGRLNEVAVPLGDQAQELGAHAATLLAGYVKIAIEHGPFIVDLPVENGGFR